MKALKLNTELTEINSNELFDVNGGIVITGTLVATAVGIFGGGIATGYAIGKIGKKILG